MISVPPSVAGFVAKASAKLVKHAPTILTYGGIGAMTAGAALGVKKTFSFEEKVISGFNDNFNKIEEVALLSDEGKLDRPYTEEEQKNDRILAYVIFAKNTAIHYALPVALFSAGIAMVVSGHNVAAKRLATTMAAYSSLHASYDKLKKAYDEQNKGKVSEMISDAVEKAADGDPEPLNEIRESRKEEVQSTAYQYRFDESNPGFHRSSNAANRSYLDSARNYFQDRLVVNGHVFLNEVLDYLNMQHTPEGAVTGWVYGSDNGDSIISFGEEDAFDMRYPGGVNPEVYVYDLNFNVDGLIWDKI